MGAGCWGRKTLIIPKLLLHVPILFSMLGSVWLGIAQIVDKVSQPLCVHMHRCSAVSKRHCFAVVIHDLQLLYSFCLLSAMIPESFKEAVQYSIYVYRAKHSEVSHSLYLGQLRISVDHHLLQTEVCLMKVSSLIYEYNELSLGFILILCAFSRFCGRVYSLSRYKFLLINFY